MREPSIESLLYFFFFFVSQIFLVWRAKILLNDCSQVVDDCSQGIQDLNEAPFLFYDHREGCICVFRYNLKKKKKRNKILSQYPVCSFTVYKLSLKTKMYRLLHYAKPSTCYNFRCCSLSGFPPLKTYEKINF